MVLALTRQKISLHNDFQDLMVSVLTNQYPQQCSGSYGVNPNQSIRNSTVQSLMVSAPAGDGHLLNAVHGLMVSALETAFFIGVRLPVCQPPFFCHSRTVYREVTLPRPASVTASVI